MRRQTHKYIYSYTDTIMNIDKYRPKYKIC